MLADSHQKQQGSPSTHAVLSRQHLTVTSCPSLSRTAFATSTTCIKLTLRNNQNLSILTKSTKRIHLYNRQTQRLYASRKFASGKERFRLGTSDGNPGLSSYNIPWRTHHWSTSAASHLPQSQK